MSLDRNLGLSIGLVIVLWAVTSSITIAFQCRLPEPWDYINRSCFNRVSSLPTFVFTISPKCLE